MALASNSRKQVAFIAESTLGVTPTTGTPAFLAVNDETLAFNVKYEESKRLRSDRQISDTVQVDASATGPIPFELSYKEFDPLLASALQGSWSTYGTNGVGAALALTLNSSAGTITAAVAPTGSDAFTTLGKGQWFLLVAPGDAANLTAMRVSTSVAPTSTVITVDTTTPLAGTGTRASVANCTISSSRLANGVTQSSFSIESQLTDVAQFFLYKGMVPGKMSLDFQSGSIVTGSFDFTGTGASRAGATALPGTATASQTYPVINAVTGMSAIIEAGVALSGTFIKTLKLDIDNTLREQKAIGVLGSAGIASGKFVCKGTMSIYLANGTLYDKFINDTATSLAWKVSDAQGNGYGFTMGNVNFTDVKRTGGGSDTDVMLDVTFTALMDSATGKTLLIDRFGA